jgi:hypothetical protein
MEANLISRLRQCCRQPSVKATAGAAPISARTGAVDKRRTHFSTTTARTNKSGGRQPAVVGKPNAVRRKSPTIRRRCDRRTRAAGVSPPWCRKPHLQRRPTFPNPARSPRHSRLSYHGWLTPAALGCTTCVRCRMRRLRCTNACAQERRASARRGAGNRICNGDRLFRTQHVPPARRLSYHGWLTPAALGCERGCCC